MKFQSIRIAAAMAVAATVGFAAQSASALETVKVAASHKGSWSTSTPIWADQQGYFKAEGIKVEIVWTRGGSDAQQAIISGAVQIATQTGILGVVSAYAKGAPIRIIGAAMTGSGGLYWYVRKDSAIKTLKDASGKTMALSRPGSSTNRVSSGRFSRNPPDRSSSATTSKPSSARRRATWAPINPAAPVTRTRSLIEWSALPIA